MLVSRIGCLQDSDLTLFRDSTLSVVDTHLLSVATVVKDAGGCIARIGDLS